MSVGTGVAVAVAVAVGAGVGDGFGVGDGARVAVGVGFGVGEGARGAVDVGSDDEDACAEGIGVEGGEAVSVARGAMDAPPRRTKSPPYTASTSAPSSTSAATVPRLRASRR